MSFVTQLNFFFYFDFIYFHDSHFSNPININPFSPLLTPMHLSPSSSTIRHSFSLLSLLSPLFLSLESFLSSTKLSHSLSAHISPAHLSLRVFSLEELQTLILLFLLSFLSEIQTLQIFDNVEQKILSVEAVVEQEQQQYQ